MSIGKILLSIGMVFLKQSVFFAIDDWNLPI